MFDYCILKLYTTFLNIDSYSNNITLDNKHHGVAEKEKTSEMVHLYCYFDFIEITIENVRMRMWWKKPTVIRLLRCDLQL